MYTIYTRDGCPYCTQVKQVLAGIGASYTELSLNSNFTREQFVEQFGAGATFPRVIKDGHLLGGCNETVVYLRNQGLV
jgi:glutaredoxin 3